MDKYLELKEKILSEIKANLPELITLNDDLADHPEVSGQEFETSRKIVELLRKKGFETEYPFSGLDTAFRGIYGSNDHKYKVAIMTEDDMHVVTASADLSAFLLGSALQNYRMNWMQTSILSAHRSKKPTERNANL